MQNFQHIPITVSEAVKYQPQVTKIFLSWGVFPALPGQEAQLQPTAYLGTARARADGFSQQQGCLEHCWAHSSSGATGDLGDNAGSPIVFLLSGSHDLWEAKLLEKSDCDHLDIFATCHHCYSSQGFFPLLSPTSDYQLRNGFKWRLISWVGALHLQGSRVRWGRKQDKQ